MRALSWTILILLAVAVVGGGLAVAVLDWRAPVVGLDLRSDSIGGGVFEVKVADSGSGLRSVTVSLVQNGTAHPVAAKEYDAAVMEDSLSVSLSREDHGIQEGPAVLQIRAVDRFSWRLFRGNQTMVEKNVTVDLTPPRLALRRGHPYMNFGGSGLVIYEASPDTVRTGISIASHFFPAHRISTGARDSYLAFFAHAYDVPADERAAIIAEDAAGNAARQSLSYRLRPVRYRKRAIEVTDRFIQQYILPLLGAAAVEDLRAAFLKVNRDMRRDNDAKITEITQKSADRMLWEGPFHQLSNSKVEANFADERTYFYRGEELDHAYHLGYDLAATRNYPVEAANNGIVVFTGDLGIYGNTIVLDHGYGLFTLYSHLSSIAVENGKQVAKKEIIGKTGQTGLATGDHLHYTTLIYGVPVLPLEWWDPKWVEGNVLVKLREVPGGLASERR